LYDVAINCSFDAFFGGMTDFWFLLRGYPRLAVHTCAWIVMLLAAYCAAREIAGAKTRRIAPGENKTGQASEPVPL